MKRIFLFGFGLLVLVACWPSKHVEQSTSLENTTWVLVAFDGNPYESKLTQSRLVSLTLQSEDNRAVGFGGCNSFSGSYTIVGNEIQFTLLSTKMFCNETMQVEDYLFKTLVSVEYSIEGDFLTLKNVEGQSVKFKKS